MDERITFSRWPSNEIDETCGVTVEKLKYKTYRLPKRSSSQRVILKIFRIFKMWKIRMFWYVLHFEKLISRSLKALQPKFRPAGNGLCISFETFLRRNACQVTYFRVSLKRNDPSDAGEKRQFRNARQKISALWKRAAPLEPSASSDISRQEIYAAQFKSQRCTRENFQPPKQPRQGNTTRNTTGCMH